MSSKSKEEALAMGINVGEVKHSMKRRSPWHDYSEKGTYMLTLVVEGRKPLFGTLCGDGFAEFGSDGVAHVELSELGQAIREREILKISEYYPMVEVWKLCVMPDHLHVIVRVKEKMPKGKHLGQVVSGFKAGCSRAWWRLQDEGRMPCGEPQGTVAAREMAMQANPATVPDGSPFATVPDGSPFAIVPDGSPSGNLRPLLFEKGYCDKILLRDGQLDNWKRYLDDNPRRLAIKRQRPDYFTVMRHEALLGMDCQMVGNRFLLDIPDKAAVIVHSAYSDSEYEKYRREWLSVGESGGVLVSAAIAKREKQVMREAMDRGYRLILLRENGFPPMYKPSGESFDACSAGQLLQIAPWEYHFDQRKISREQCLKLNSIAEDIVNLL